MILVYHLLVSAGQESRRGSAGFSAQGPTRLQPRCQPGCVLIRGSAGEGSAPKFPLLVDRTHLLVVVELMVSFIFVASRRVRCLEPLTSGRAPAPLLKGSLT